jgi:hypothetical protein
VEVVGCIGLPQDTVAATQLGPGNSAKLLPGEPARFAIRSFARNTKPQDTGFSDRAEALFWLKRRKVI